MQSSFEKAFEHTVGLEGGYSNNPADKGGPTMYGITQKTAMGNGYYGPMYSLPIDTAKKIFKKDYWDKLRLDDIAKISEPIAIELFDTAVNMGIGTAGKFLQRALNLTTIGIRLAEDGIIGDQTLFSLKGWFSQLKEPWQREVLLKMLNAQQCVRYMEIVENNLDQRVFLMGWIDKRVQ